MTDQKLAQEAMQKISGKLIEAQEAERARIARELHDDFSQRLAVQSIELTQLERNLPASEVEERARALKLLKDTKEMSADVRSLSHELHSSRLELVGLVPALRGLCEEIARKYELDVHFAENEVPPILTKHLQLCFFRVAQEALGNVVKHSHAGSARVELYANPNTVSLRISDTGTGFDFDPRRVSDGIGLIGMRERLRLVGGKLSIGSEPGRGTEILAEIPRSKAVLKEPVMTRAEEGMES